MLLNVELLVFGHTNTLSSIASSYEEQYHEITCICFRVTGVEHDRVFIYIYILDYCNVKSKNRAKYKKNIY